MTSVGIRELKSRLSEFIRRVQLGEAIRVTSHGEVVAELRPPSPRVPGSPVEGLEELVRGGLAHKVVRNDSRLYTPREPVLRRTTVRDLLAEEREDRR